MNDQEMRDREHIALVSMEKESFEPRHTFVEAGAGAGKTRLIRDRICNLLKKGIYKPEEIVVITFTNKAAEELYTRIYQGLDKLKEEGSEEDRARIQEARENIDRMCISTIHSFCSRILQEQSFYAGRGMGYTMATEADSEKMKKEFLKKWFVAYCKDEKSKETIEVLERLAGNGYYKNIIEASFLEVCDRFDEEPVIPEDYEKIAQALTIDRIEEEAKNLVTDFFAEVDGTVRSYYGIPLSNVETPDIGSKFQQFVDAYKDGFRQIDSYQQLLLDKMRSAFGNAVIGTKTNASIDKYLDPTGTMPKKQLETARKLAKAAFKDLKELTGAEYKEKARGLYMIREAMLYAYAMPVIKEAAKAFAISRGFSEGEKALLSDTSLVSEDELLHLTRKLVQSEEVIQRFQKQYRCYFVDEFQDTDHVQKEIIWRLTGLDQESTGVPEVTAFFVGDPKQSIYRFRGAEVKVFYEAKQELESHPYADVYELHYNFRSNETIIQEINKAFGSRIEDYEDMEAWEIGTVSRAGMLCGVYQCNKEEYEYAETGKGNGVELDAKNLARLVCQLLQEGKYHIYDREEECVRNVCAKDIMVLVHRQKDIPAYIRELNRLGVQANVSGNMSISNHDVLKRYVDFVGYLAWPRDSYAKALAIQSFFNRPVFLCTKNEYTDYAKHLEEVFRPYKKETPEKVLRQLLSKYEWILSEETENYYYVSDARTKLHQMLETVLLNTTGTLQEYHEALKDYCEKKVERELIMDMDAPAIRVMNVHKAKGLEAPIIILANRKTTIEFKEGSISKDGKRYQSIKHGWGEYAPSISGYMLNDTLRDMAEKEELDEAVRLEYVTATRAEEALFLLPVFSGKKPLLHSERFDVAKTSFVISYEPEEDRKEENENLQVQISRTGLEAKLADMGEEESEQVLLSITPSGLESKITKQRDLAGAGQEVTDSAEEPEEGEETLEQFMQMRPRGNIFGTAMHRFFELLANELVKQAPGKRVLSEEWVKLYSRQAVMESSEKILERYPEYASSVAKKYMDFLQGLLAAGSDASKRFTELLQDAREIFTELPFSYYLSEEETKGFAGEFGMDILETQKVWINGTTDLVIRMADGSLKIVDYKSDDLSAMSEEAKKAYLEDSYGAQMQLYRYSAAKIFGVAKEDITSEFFHLYQ